MLTILMYSSIYLVVCATIWIIMLLCTKYIDGLVCVEDLVRMAILAILPVINVLIVVIFLICVAGKTFDTMYAYYNGVKYNKVW
jgi:hypothetical protein